MKSVSVHEATHVKVAGKIERIKSRWGISPTGTLARPSEGGFGVVTESGRSVSMWDAESYYREDE